MTQLHAKNLKPISDGMSKQSYHRMTMADAEYGQVPCGKDSKFETKKANFNQLLIKFESIYNLNIQIFIYPKIILKFLNNKYNYIKGKLSMYIVNNLFMYDRMHTDGGVHKAPVNYGIDMLLIR